MLFQCTFFGRLTTLLFNFFVFVGTLPEGLFALPYLQEVILFENYFTGSLSPISSQYLGVFDISSNFLSGEFPWSTVCGLSGYSLIAVYLDNNLISGSLTDDLVQCSSLEQLSLIGNRLTGTIPISAFVYSSNTLSYLDLSYNLLSGNLSGLDMSFALLEQLSVMHGFLTGSLPPSLFSSPSLLAFSGAYNFIDGDLPDTLRSAMFTSLLELGMDDSLLSWTFTSQLFSAPQGFTGPPSLEYLQLQNNPISGNLSAILPFISLRYLWLSTTYLSGSIPPQLCSLSALESLFLFQTNIRGSIPTCFFPQILQSSEVIPSSFSALTDLNLGNLSLTGSLPYNMSSMTQLKELVLSFNSLTGPLPLYWPKSITSLFLSNNHFYGELPLRGLAALPALDVLFIDANLLSCDFSTNPDVGLLWESASVLRYLQLGENQFTGAVAPFLQQFSNLIVLSLQVNGFTGSLPSLNSFSSQGIALFRNNFFAGPILSSLSQIRSLSQLEVLSTSYNLLTGPLPNFSDLTWEQRRTAALLIYFCDNNFLEGPAANALALPSLQELSMGNNFLTGSLPDVLIQNLTALEAFLLGSNQLTGTVPASLLGTSPDLTKLFLADNMLVGDIGTSLNGLLALGVNESAGAINAKISEIVLAGNLLTGKIPWNTLAMLNTLEHFEASSNCISGPAVTSEICNSRTLTELYLNGMRTASTCRRNTLPGFHTFVLDDPTPATTIPPCLFAMSTLQNLELAGNGLYGTIPDMATILRSVNLTNTDSQVNMTLSTLALTSNELTGSIPTWLQEHKFTSLFVDNNKLNGELLSTFNAYTAINGDFRSNVNRLSGQIPSVFLESSHVSILNGNLFFCKSDRSDLPPADPVYTKYSCGSNAVNQSLSAWIGVVGGTAVFVVMVYAWVVRAISKRSALDSSQTDAVKTMQKTWWWFLHQVQYYVRSIIGKRSALFFRTTWVSHLTTDVSTNSSKREAGHNCGEDVEEDEKVLSMLTRTGGSKSLDSYFLLRGLLESARKFFAGWMLLFVVVFMPIYAGLTVRFGTHTNEYTWTTSSVYLSGLAPAGLLFVFYVLILFVCWVIMIYTRRYSEAPAQQSASLYTWQYALFVFVNFVVILGCDLAYVAAVLRASPSEVQIAALALSFAKIAWTNLYIKRFFIWLKSTLLQRRAEVLISAQSLYSSHDNPLHAGLETSSTASSRRPSSPSAGSIEVLNGDDYAVITFLIVTNAIWIPSIAVILISSTCFYHVFEPLPSFINTIVFSSIYYYADAAITSRVVVNTESTIVSHTPFVYSYTCASSVMTYFGAAFIYQMMTASVVMPIAALGMRFLYVRLRQQSLLHRVLRKIVWAALPPASKILVASEDEEAAKLLLEQSLPSLLKEHHHEGHNAEDAEANGSKEFSTAVRRESVLHRLPLFDRFIVPQIYGLVALLLAFGATFPLLAIPIFIAACVLTTTEELMLLRICHYASVYQIDPVAEAAEAGEAKSHDDSSSKRPVATLLLTYLLRHAGPEVQALLYNCSNPRLVLLVLVAVVPLFTLLVFDTAGDAAGVNAGLGLGLTVLFVPLLLYLLRKYIISRSRFAIVDKVVHRIENRVRAIHLSLSSKVSRGSGTVSAAEVELRSISPTDSASQLNAQSDQQSSSNAVPPIDEQC